jgi:4-hydroxy-4-methyl-2-oxoglutarate aldolase
MTMMMLSHPGAIYTRIPSADPALVAEAGRYAIADLHEALGSVAGRMALMSPRMRPTAPGHRVVGQAVTAYNFPGDNLMIHKALQLAQAGQVLVLTNGGGQHGALWGDVAGTFAKKKGIAGVVVDGPARDIDELRAMELAVWATAISPSHPQKRGPGAVNVPVVCDGVLVNPGDIIAADGDGVLVIPREHLQATVEGARARNAKEVDIRRRIGAGESLFDILGMQALIEAAGIPERDEVWPGARD